MDLFSPRSLWTMFHGIGLSGGALIGLSIALYALLVTPRRANESLALSRQSRALSLLLTGTSVLLWLAVLAGTYILFPAYRATPPAGAAALVAYPRAFLLADADTAWLHSFAMECKEHMPWIAAILTTSAAFAGLRNRGTILADAGIRSIATSLVAVALALSAFVGLLGIFVNKVAPLQ